LAATENNPVSELFRYLVVDGSVASCWTLAGFSNNRASAGQSLFVRTLDCLDGL